MTVSDYGWTTIPEVGEQIATFVLPNTGPIELTPL
jgi:hypothetical protein